jgi:adenosylcobinamide amidohydrolase
MDTMVVASTGRGLFSLYAGTSTLVGYLIGLAVYDAMAAGIRLEQEAAGNPYAPLPLRAEY